MDAGGVIAIIAGVLVLLLLLAWALPRIRGSRKERLRNRAGEERYEARGRELSAEQAQAAADEQAARARRQAAQAEVSAREAAGQREVAGEHRERARELDPDTDEDPGDRDREARFTTRDGADEGDRVGARDEARDTDRA
jgi:hypothetical protein